MHLRVVLSLYALQMQKGKYVLHEHPAGETSWTEQVMLNFLQRPGVDVVKIDQCRYGLYSQTPNGDLQLALKPTTWASKTPHMLKRLAQRCTKDHPHKHLEGGRAKAAAYYPPSLILAILRGSRDTADPDHLDADD